MSRTLEGTVPEGARIQSTPIVLQSDHRGVLYYAQKGKGNLYKSTGEPFRPVSRLCKKTGASLRDVFDIGAGAGAAYAILGGPGALAGAAIVYGAKSVIDWQSKRQDGLIELQCLERARWENKNWRGNTLPVPLPQETGGYRSGRQHYPNRVNGQPCIDPDKTLGSMLLYRGFGKNPPPGTTFCR